MKIRKGFGIKSERELCSSFIAAMNASGWKAYPESGGYDILLEKDGLQLGVEAKLKFTARLMRQILPYPNQTTGPNYLGILLPFVDRDVAEVADRCRLIYFYPHGSSIGDSAQFTFKDPFDNRYLNIRGLKQWDFKSPLKVPEFTPDVPAGVPSPVQLTPWKIAALKVCATLEINGHVTKKDFDLFGIKPSLWTQRNWLAYDVQRKWYVRGRKGPPMPDQHPVVFAEIVAKFKTHPPCQK